MKKTRDPKVAAIRQRNMAARAKRNPESVKPKELEKAHEEAVQPKSIVKKELDQWLDDVDYSFLNSNKYMPSQFALQFANFIKLVNGDTPESHKTPPVHLAMLDKLASESQYVVNLCSRGLAKTTLFMEYLTLYLAVFHELPHLGEVSGMVYVADSMENGAKNARKNIETRYVNSAFLQEWIPEAKFTDTYLEFKNKAGQMLGVKLFGATTGIRGTKIFAKRPTLCCLDDLISDEASKSKTVMQLIRDTIYKGINHALDPVHRKVIFNGTPFNKDDVLIEAVESGAWDVNVWPVCEKFPVEEKDFQGAWPDRFSYNYIKSQYDMAVNTGQINAFNQELMLRITSEEDRLIQDSEIKWFSRQDLLQNRQNFNFYITTDFATSSKQTADDSVISVWAYNANGDWFWVDGICAKQSMDKTVDDLFRFVLLYKPQEVGIEVTGQQGAFISWLQKEQLTRNIWFNFAKNPGSKSPGIRPTVDKLSRLNMVVPWFKMGKVFFPEEMKSSTIIGTFMQEIKLATRSGLKGHDDCLDTISMLAFLNPWKPQESMLVNAEGRTIYEDYPELDPGYMRNDSPMDSYMV